jgi:hypothetical protein
VSSAAFSTGSIDMIDESLPPLDVKIDAFNGLMFLLRYVGLLVHLALGSNYECVCCIDCCLSVLIVRVASAASDLICAPCRQLADRDVRAYIQASMRTYIHPCIFALMSSRRARGGWLNLDQLNYDEQHIFPRMLVGLGAV